MLHVCVQRFNMMKNLEKICKILKTKQTLSFKRPLTAAGGGDSLSLSRHNSKEPIDNDSGCTAYTTIYLVINVKRVGAACLSASRASKGEHGTSLRVRGDVRLV